MCSTYPFVGSCEGLYPARYTIGGTSIENTVPPSIEYLPVRSRSISFELTDFPEAKKRRFPPFSQVVYSYQSFLFLVNAGYAKNVTFIDFPRRTLTLVIISQISVERLWSSLAMLISRVLPSPVLSSHSSSSPPFFPLFVYVGETWKKSAPEIAA